MAQEDQSYVNVSESGSEVANATQSATSEISDSELYGEGETVNVGLYFVLSLRCADEALLGQENGVDLTRTIDNFL